MLDMAILERVAVLSCTRLKTKEANIVSYNGGPPVLDLRTFRSGCRTIKGVTLNAEELEALMRGIMRVLERGGKYGKA